MFLGYCTKRWPCKNRGTGFHSELHIMYEMLCLRTGFFAGEEDGLRDVPRPLECLSSGDSA